MGDHPYNAFMAKAETPEPAPFERFEEAAKRIFSVPKKDLEKAELRRKKEQEAARGEAEQSK